MKRIWVMVIICVIPILAGAQEGTKHARHKQKETHAVQTETLPPWGPAHNYDAKAHAYFPDYYTYYDPARGGYVYWNNGKWTFSPSVPPFLEKVDMSKTRVQILKGLSLDLHPERNYPHYMKLYPAEHENNMVPVPIPGTPGN